MSWTPERVEMLKDLWAKGLSGGQIAARLKGVTRSAVIGKVHRLSLPSPIKKQPRDFFKRVARKSAYKPGKKINNAKTKPITPNRHISQSFNPKSPGDRQPRYTAQVHKDRAKSIGSAKLTARTCRFPLGDATGTEQKFCGRKCELKDTYCREHHQLTHTPLKSRYPVNVGNPKRPYAPSNKAEF